MIVNKTAFEGLPEDLQAIITGAAREANQDMLDQYTARNPVALKAMVERGDAELRRLPDDVLQRLYTLSRDIYAEQAAQDPLFRKVYHSYRDFLARASNYHKITEQTYYQVRESVTEHAED